MKSIKLKLFLIVTLVSTMFMSNCAVDNPSSDDVFPMMKASAVQFFILGQAGRWLAATNEYTPYTLNSFSNFNTTNLSFLSNNVIGTNTNQVVLTNIDTLVVSTNTNYDPIFDPVTNTNVLDFGSMNISYNGAYSYTADIDFYLTTNLNSADPLTLTNTNYDSFLTSYSNAATVGMYGTIHYIKSNLTFDFTFSNYIISSKSESSPYFTNYVNAMVSESNLDCYIAGIGVVSNENGIDNFTATYKSGVSLIYSGTRTNSYENMSQNIQMFTSVGTYTYYCELRYSSLPDFTMNIGNIEKMDSAYTINVNLTKGE